LVAWATAFTDPAVAAALEAMHREPAHPWTVASLAALAGLARAPFAKRFTDLTGGPPMRYLTWWRMTTAARLLRTTQHHRRQGRLPFRTRVRHRIQTPIRHSTRPIPAIGSLVPANDQK